MQIARTLAQLRAARAGLTEAGGTSKPSKLALVATMGALHEGHMSLVRAAQAAAYTVAASIFVNPTQFGPDEDFARYPRDVMADCAILQQAGCAMVWLPDVATMYPPGSSTFIEVGGPALQWEGASRSGHFRGVATVVAKLFGQVRPDAAYFGEKDWQQVQVIRRMVEDLLLPVEIIAAPTWRETTGLAMSSRNRYLGDRHRNAAPRLFAVLNHTREEIRAGQPVVVGLAAARATLEDAGFAVDYLALVDAETLETLDRHTAEARLIAAVRLGETRLLDNIAL